MSGWRDTYLVHPAADVFPMMTDAEINDLAADIKKHGLSRPIVFFVTTKPDGRGRREGISLRLLDGRNRLEALQRIGRPVTECMKEYLTDFEPVAYVVSANIKRRHLTKTQQAELIVAAVQAGEKLDHDEPVSRGGRGKVNAVKAKACRLAAEAGISSSTIKRVITGPKRRPSTLGAPIVERAKRLISHMSPAEKRTFFDWLVQEIERDNKKEGTNAQ